VGGDHYLAQGTGRVNCQSKNLVRRVPRCLTLDCLLRSPAPDTGPASRGGKEANGAVKGEAEGEGKAEGRESAERGSRRGGRRPKTTVVTKPCVLGARNFWTAVERKATATARQRTRLARFDIESLIALAAKAPSQVVDLVLLAAQSLFPEIKQFISLGLSRHWRNAGDTLFRQGEPAAGGLYVLITGRVKLKSRHSQTVTELGRADMLGEEAFLTRDAATSCRRLSTAVCMRDCEFVSISPTNFEIICRKYPRVALTLMKSIARRSFGRRSAPHGTEPLPGGRELSGERLAARSLTANLATLAVVPANPESEEATSALVRRLADELRKFGKVLLLDVASIASVLGVETVTSMQLPFYRTRIASWIVQQEEDYRFVVMQGDPRNEPWTAICVSQADSVLISAHHASIPALGAIEKACVWNGEEGCVRAVRQEELGEDPAQGHMILDVRRELVLLHPGVGGPGAPPPSPRCTKKFFDHRPGLTLHHNVRPACDADMKRLARHLAGRAVGLVLGGGGARGLAHLGVLRAMEEVGVPVDFIGGTSQGAFMAALYAQWCHTGSLGERCNELCNGVGSVSGLLRDFTLPILSMFSGKSFST